MTITQVLTVQKWAQERDLYKFGDFETQSIKMYEEFGEYCKHMLKRNDEEKIDAIGDMIVVFINMIHFSKLDAVIFASTIPVIEPDLISSEKHLVICVGLALSDAIKYELTINSAVILYQAIAKLSMKIEKSVEYCTGEAIKEIINRKGAMINGSFVKE